MKVQIITDVFRRIDEDLLLDLDDGGYRVWIKEVRPTNWFIINMFLDKKKMDSNDKVLGFEHLEDDMGVDNEVARRFEEK